MYYILYIYIAYYYIRLVLERRRVVYSAADSCAARIIDEIKEEKKNERERSIEERKNRHLAHTHSADHRSVRWTFDFSEFFDIVFAQREKPPVPAGHQTAHRVCARVRIPLL